MQARSDNSKDVSPSLTRQSLWILSAKTLGFGFSILLPLIVVRSLAPDDVGIYRQSFLVIVSATSILPLGFSMSAYYFLNRERERRDATILNIVLFNFIAGGAAFVLLSAYPSLLGNLFRDVEMAALAPLVGLAIWLAIFSAFLETAALANREAKLATAIIVFAQLSKAALMGGAAYFIASAEAIVISAIVQGVGQTLVLVLFLRSRFPNFWRSFDWAFFTQHLRYALPFGLAAFLYNAQADLHHYFVAHKYSSADYAIYAYGCFQLPLIWAVYESISAVLLPRMSELQSQGRMDEMLRIIASGVRKLAFAYFPLFVFLTIVAEVFVTTLFTDRFSASVSIFRINLLLLPLYSLMILDPLERSFKELGPFLSKVRALTVGGLAVVLFFGIETFGMTGAIGAAVLFVLIEKIVSASKLARVMKVHWRDLSIFRPVARVALAATLAGVGLFALLSATGNFLLATLTEMTRIILTSVGFSVGWEFFGGSVFLGLTAATYFLAYLLIALRLGAVDMEETRSAAAAIDRIKVRLRGLRLPGVGKALRRAPVEQ